MTRITIDPTLFSQLTATQGPVEFCSQDGAIAGVFHPTGSDDDWWRNPPESEEELARRCADTRGRTMAEVRADVERQA